MKKHIALILTAVLALALFAAPAFAAKEPQGEQDAEFVGYIGYDPNGADEIWGSFNSSDPSVITNLNVRDAAFTFAAASAGTTIYGYNYDSNGSDIRFYTIDTDTWTLSYPGTSALAFHTVYGMAYDYTENIMYALAADNSNDHLRGLYTVDRATGLMTYISEFIDSDGDPMGHGDPIIVIAIDNEGTMFGISYFGELYSIDKDTAMCHDIGFTGIEMQYAQSMTWDMNTNRLYWAHYNTTGTLYAVDTETAELTELGTIGGGAEVLGLCTLYSDADIPEPIPPDMTVTFVDGIDGSFISEYTLPAGSVIPQEAFPEAPEHPGLEFGYWGYDGAAVYSDITVSANYIDPNGIGWYFEEDPEDEGWYWFDEDGDGYEWAWLINSSMNVPEGEGFMNSQSYVNGYGALMPDNWLVSPDFEAGSFVSFMMVGQDRNYASECIGVYVSADGGSTWSDEIAFFTASSAVATYYVDTSAYFGENIRIAFRHYNVTDMFSVNLDAVEVLGAGGGEAPTEPPVEPTEAPSIPTEPPVEPTETPGNPTELPVEPTEAPSIPTEPPLEPTETPEDPTEAPTDPTPTPAPVPGTGAAALSSFGIAALLSGCGAVLFRKQEN